MIDPEKVALNNALRHAMQSGVAHHHKHDATDGSPKHLRVGVNAVAVDHAALVGLLIKKGIFTEDEYIDALNEGMSREVKAYEKLLTDLLGITITLG